MINTGLFSQIAEQLFSSATSGRTPNLGLRRMVFRDGGRVFIAIEQNQAKASQWARLAKQGHKVVQFKEGDRYVAVSVDGNVTAYGQ